ncbi:MAG: Sec-independent protein translocase subunit TatA/TatB [Rectinemataceae bacterium]
MFNIGLPEFLVIALLAIVVIKPDQLPGLFRNLGKGLRQVARIRNEIMEGLREVKQDLGLDGELLKGAESRGVDGRGSASADSLGARGGAQGDRSLASREADAPKGQAAAPGSPAAPPPHSGTESYDQGGGI